MIPRSDIMRLVKTLIKLSMISLICFMFIGNAYAADEAVYDISISKESGSIVAKDYNGNTIASGAPGVDDAAVIQKAFDSINREAIVYFDSSEYTISKPITVNNKDLVLQGKDTKFNINTGSNSPGFTFKGTNIKSTPFSSNANEGDNKVILADTSGVNAGDLIRIYNDELWCPDQYPTHKTGEMYIVESVSGNTVTLNSNLIRDYTTALNSRAIIYRPITVEIDDCQFIGTGVENRVKGITLEYCKDSKISNCYFEDNGQASIYLLTCYGVEVSGNTILDSNMAGYGYGVAIVNACSNITIHKNIIRNCRHTITSGDASDYGVNREVYISNNTLYRDDGKSAVVDAHPSTLNYVVTNNTIYADGKVAFNDGTLHSVFSNNKVYNGIAITQRGYISGCTKVVTGNYIEKGSIISQNDEERRIEELVIKDNIVVGDDSDYGVLLSGIPVNKITITGNSINGVNYGIRITDKVNPSQIIVADNTIEDISKSGIYINREVSSDESVLNIYNNHIKSVNRDNGDAYGIELINVRNADVYGNEITDEYGQTKYGIIESSSCDYNQIYGNLITGMSDGLVNLRGSNSIAEDNGAITLNPAPVIENIMEQKVEEGSTLTFTVKATDVDGDSLTYSALNLPTGAIFDSQSGIFTWTPAEGQNGIYEVTFKVSDGNLSDSTRVSITVVGGDIPSIPSTVYDNRLREASPDAVLGDDTYIDVGDINGQRKYRDVLWFDLSTHNDSESISKATLSLFWNYPNRERPEDTILEVYRPQQWNPEYVSWNNRDINTPWEHAGGDWFDKNNTSQGSTPYATITINGSDLPDGRYCELDVTELVKEYASGKYENTGFFIKAREENNNYISFYSSDCGSEDKVPKLNVEYAPTNNIPTNNAPVMEKIENQTVNEGNSLNFALNATDADGDILTYSASNLPTGAA